MSYKVQFGADIRRFFLDPNSFFALREKLISLFNLPEPQVSWRDDEGDLVTIACEEDLRAAVAAANGQTIRLFVSERSEFEDADEASLSDMVVVPAPPRSPVRAPPPSTWSVTSLAAGGPPSVVSPVDDVFAPTPAPPAPARDEAPSPLAAAAAVAAVPIPTPTAPTAVAAEAVAARGGGDDDEDDAANPPPDTPATPMTPRLADMLLLAPLLSIPPTIAEDPAGASPHPEPSPQPSPAPVLLRLNPVAAGHIRHRPATDAHVDAAIRDHPAPDVFVLPPPDALPRDQEVGVLADPDVIAGPAPATAETNAPPLPAPTPLLTASPTPAVAAGLGAGAEAAVGAGAGANVGVGLPGRSPNAGAGAGAARVGGGRVRGREEPPSPLEATFHTIAAMARSFRDEIERVIQSVVTSPNTNTATTQQRRPSADAFPAYPTAPRVGRAATAEPTPDGAATAEEPSEGAAAAAAGGGGDEPVVHAGVVCDVCESPIVGRRFKCCVCPDFDLCMRCEATGAHADHPMVRLCRPAPPRGLWQTRCPRWARRFISSLTPTASATPTPCAPGACPAGPAGCGGAATHTAATSTPPPAPTPTPTPASVPGLCLLSGRVLGQPASSHVNGNTTHAPTQAAATQAAATQAAAPQRVAPTFPSYPSPVTSSTITSTPSMDRSHGRRQRRSPPPPVPLRPEIQRLADQWVDEMRSIREMGFELDDETLVEVLRQSNGVVADAVSRLLA